MVNVPADNGAAAIPVDFAMDIANQLIEHGTASAGTPQGLFVQAVAPGGPAAAAGIHAGDVITESPGDAVEIEHWRDGHTATATVTLGSASQT